MPACPCVCQTSFGPRRPGRGPRQPLERAPVEHNRPSHASVIPASRLLATQSPLCTSSAASTPSPATQIYQPCAADRRKPADDREVAGAQSDSVDRAVCPSSAGFGQDLGGPGSRQHRRGFLAGHLPVESRQRRANSCKISEVNAERNRQRPRFARHAALRLAPFLSDYFQDICQTRPLWQDPFSRSMVRSSILFPRLMIDQFQWLSVDHLETLG